MYNVQRPLLTQINPKLQKVFHVMDTFISGRINQNWTDLASNGKKVKQANSAGTT